MLAGPRSSETHGTSHSPRFNWLVPKRDARRKSAADGGPLAGSQEGHLCISFRSLWSREGAMLLSCRPCCSQTDRLVWWIHRCGTSRPSRLRSTFGFHPLAIQGLGESESGAQRFIVVRTVFWCCTRRGPAPAAVCTTSNSSVELPGCTSMLSMPNIIPAWRRVS